MNLTTTKFYELNQLIQEMDVRVYEQLGEDNPKEAKQQFLTSQMGAPLFSMTPQRLKAFNQSLALVGDVRWDIRESGCSNTERIILEKMRKQALVANQHALRVLTGHSEIDFEHPQDIWRAGVVEREELEQASRQYYGYTVNPLLFRALLHEALEEMTRNIDDWDKGADFDELRDNWTDEDRKYLREIGEILSQHGLSDVWGCNDELKAMIYQPQPELLEKFGQLANRKLAPILSEPLASGQILSADETVNILNDFFDGLRDKTRFRAEKDTKSTFLSVSQQERLVKIPEFRSNGPIDDFIFETKMRGHEIGTHTGRGIPYEQTELTILSTGFLDYEGPEEGIAACIERALAHLLGKELTNCAPVDYYVNIGLADQGKLDFRELFTVRRNLIYLTEVQRDSDRSAIMQHATDKAYGQVRRVFRGTGTIIDYKDLFYYVEEENTWKFIEKFIDRPDELWFTLMGMGKANILNADVRDVLRSIMTSDVFPLTKAQLTREKSLIDTLMSEM